MATGLDLKRVQKGRGRIHLTPALRRSEPVRTLCGKELPAAGTREVDAEADCSICLRRRRDPAAVSTAFFLGGAGEDVLELSLEQALARRRAERPSEAVPPAPRRAVAAESARRAASTPRSRSGSSPEAEPEPDAGLRRVGELETRGLREFSEGVYVAPGGLVVRLARGRLAEIVGEGRYQLRRRGERLTLNAGGIVIEARVTDVEVRAQGDR